MYLNETNEDCEKQLEDAGWVVYNPTELKVTGEGCQKKPLLQCAKVLLDEKSIKYEINKFNNKCYLIIKKDERNVALDGVTKKLYKRNITLWEDGIISIISTLMFPHTITSGNYKDKKIIQYMYEGDFKCNGTSFVYDNMEYKGLFDFNDFNNVIPEFIEIKTLGPDGQPRGSGKYTNKILNKSADDVLNLLK
jgi:hypothetical protein